MVPGFLQHNLKLNQNVSLNTLLPQRLFAGQVQQVVLDFFMDTCSCNSAC